MQTSVFQLRLVFCRIQRKGWLTQLSSTQLNVFIVNPNMFLIFQLLQGQSPQSVLHYYFILPDIGQFYSSMCDSRLNGYNFVVFVVRLVPYSRAYSYPICHIYSICRLANSECYRPRRQETINSLHHVNLLSHLF